MIIFSLARSILNLGEFLFSIFRLLPFRYRSTIFVEIRFGFLPYFIIECISQFANYKDFKKSKLIKKCWKNKDYFKSFFLSIHIPHILLQIDYGV